MSYLPGPLTREQIAQLTTDEQRNAGVATQTGNGATAAPVALADNESAVAPQTADNIQVRYLDPGVDYADEIGASAVGKRLRAALAVRVEMLFDDTKAKLKHKSEWEAIITPLDGPVDADDATLVDYDDRDLVAREPDGMIYLLPDAKIKNKTYFTSAKKAIKDHIYANEELELFYNKALKVYSRVGESRDDFEQRCQTVADGEADKDAEKLRKVLTKKMDRINASIKKAEDKIREIQFDAISRKQDQRTSQVIDIAGGVLGSLLGGRRSTRSMITSGIRRNQSKGRMAQKAQERLRTAENRYADLVDDREELEAEVSDDLIEIQDEWSEKALEVDSVTVGLEKADITIDDVALVWIPVD